MRPFVCLFVHLINDLLTHIVFFRGQCRHQYVHQVYVLVFSPRYFDIALLSIYASTAVHNSTNDTTLYLEACMLNDLPASTLCNISCSEWHGCTGTHNPYKLPNNASVELKL